MRRKSQVFPSPPQQQQQQAPQPAQYQPAPPDPALGAMIDDLRRRVEILEAERAEMERQRALLEAQVAAMAKAAADKDKEGDSQADLLAAAANTLSDTVSRVDAIDGQLAQQSDRLDSAEATALAHSRKLGELGGQVGDLQVLSTRRTRQSTSLSRELLAELNRNGVNLGNY